MASKHTLDALAKRIRLGIEKLGCHSLLREDLHELWNQTQDLSLEEKTMLLNNFVITYGYQVQLNTNLSLALFYASGKTALHREVHSVVPATPLNATAKRENAPRL